MHGEEGEGAEGKRELARGTHPGTVQSRDGRMTHAKDTKIIVNTQCTNEGSRGAVPFPRVGSGEHAAPTALYTTSDAA